MLISNEPIKNAHLQKLANQSMVNGAFVIEMVKTLLVKARKTSAVWWSYSEVQKNKKVDNV